MRRSDSELSPSACGPLPPPPCPNRPKSPFPALMAYVAIPRPRRRPNPIGKSSAEDDDDDDDDARTRPKPIGQSSSASVAAPRDAASPRATPPPPPREDALARRPAARLAAEASRDIVVDASRYVPAPTLRTRHHARLFLLFLPGVFPPVSRARQVRSFTHHSVSIFDRVTFQLTDRQTRAFVSRRFVSCTKSVARARRTRRAARPRAARDGARARRKTAAAHRARGDAPRRKRRPRAERDRPRRVRARRRSERSIAAARPADAVGHARDSTAGGAGHAVRARGVARADDHADAGRGAAARRRGRRRRRRRRRRDGRAPGSSSSSSSSASGAFYTLVPIRPRRRGERRSLRTFAVVSLRPPLAFNPRHRRLSTPTDAFQLHPDIRSYRTALILIVFRIAVWCPRSPRSAPRERRARRSATWTVA
jgi:hypothetical protein